MDSMFPTDTINIITALVSEQFLNGTAQYRLCSDTYYLLQYIC